MFGVERIMGTVRVVRPMCIAGTVCIVCIVLPCRCATGLAEKCEVRCSCHVCRGEECATQTNDHEERVAIGANIVDNFIFGEKARERKHTAQGQRRHRPRSKGDGHVLAQPTHVFFHVK